MTTWWGRGGAMTGKNWALAAVAGAISMTLIGGAAVAGVQPVRVG